MDKLLSWNNPVIAYSNLYSNYSASGVLKITVGFITAEYPAAKTMAVLV
ncbi:MAG: hypothetical protein KA954_00960 [Chitinophagales bacterium]|nr:hypothetical protein [Chitinophagales bacterium]MBP9190873.1 hypothetical protein [Chitinophagales bacterium]MBP9703277.1 hypothetical protein [Chitinophagales bacterium]